MVKIVDLDTHMANGAVLAVKDLRSCMLRLQTISRLRNCWIPGAWNLR